MMQIKIADTQFAHGTSLGSGDLKIYPKHFAWYRGQDNINDIIVITESMFHKVDEFTEKIKIAWLLEPESISPESYKWIKDNYWKFDYVLSHNRDFISYQMPQLHEINAAVGTPGFTKILWYPFGGCWIMPEDRKIYDKSKSISIIASGKNETEGHKLRHEVIKAMGDKVDVYGHGYNPVKYKLDALKDYKYSIVIENQMTPGWFTEKVIDCFVTGTIPIYWGDPEIHRLFFYGDCVEKFDCIEQLKNKLETIENSYKGIILSEVQKMNFELAKQYTCPEDWLYNNFFMKQEILKNQLIKFNIL